MWGKPDEDVLELKEVQREEAKTERRKMPWWGEKNPVCRVHMKAEFVLQKNATLAYYYLPMHFEHCVGHDCKIQIFARYMSVM